MKQYSKGPWWLSDKQPDAVLTADPSASEGYRYAEDNLQYYGGHLVAESIAPQNHQLIAAAPELLEALEGLVLAQTEGYTLETAKKLGLEYEYAVGGVSLLSNFLREKAKDAIAKAKGQNPA